MGSNLWYFTWGGVDSTPPCLKLLKGIFGVKCNNNPKRVQKYEILAFEKKIPKGCPKKKILKIFQKIKKKNWPPKNM